MGTPEFAVPSLERLHDSGFEIAAVVTSIDKLGGRGGRQLLESAVKRAAVARGIPVLQPEKLRDPAFLDALRSLKADLQVVVAFRMLPEAVWAMPRLGTINLHSSLLPRYRGAAPINWAVIRGERETGLTTFFIRQAIDTGDVLLQARTPIGENETAGELHDRLMEIGADLLLETVRGIEAGTLQARPQDDAEATPAPKIFHDTCRIDFGLSLGELHNFIRGMSPYPGAWTLLDGEELKLLRARPEAADHNLQPGTMLVEKRQIRIAVPGGYLHIEELQPQGKRRMSAGDFINGWRRPEMQMALGAPQS